MAEIKSFEELKPIIEHNMKYLELTYEQYVVHHFMSEQPVSDYPPSLRKYLHEQSKIYGFCGDCAAVWTAEWIKDNWLK